MTALQLIPKAMKSHTQSRSRYRAATQSFVLVFAFLAGLSASAQNLLNNPGFESPLSTNDWTVMYINSGPPDFFPADRSSFKAHSGSFGGQLSACHDGKSHAYFKQTVSGLLPGTNYVVSGWLAWALNDAQTSKYDVYIEAIGGLGSVTSPSATDDWGPSNDETFHSYTVTQTADHNGKIEVRLHMDHHTTSACCDHLWEHNGFFDDISLTRL
jgi:hypothetical protein